MSHVSPTRRRKDGKTSWTVEVSLRGETPPFRPGLGRPVLQDQGCRAVRVREPGIGLGLPWTKMRRRVSPTRSTSPPVVASSVTKCLPRSRRSSDDMTPVGRILSLRGPGPPWTLGFTPRCLMCSEVFQIIILRRLKKREGLTEIFHLSPGLRSPV